MDQFDSGSFGMWDLVKLGSVSDDKFLDDDTAYLQAPMETILSDIDITDNVNEYVHIKTDESSDQHTCGTDFNDTTSGLVDLPTCTSGTLAAVNQSAAPSAITATGPALLPTVTTGVGVNADCSKAGQDGVVKKPRNRRRRTAKQQELNRLAQQRYRERKKQKYSSLQAAVDELNIQLAKLDLLQAEKDMLQNEHNQLQVVVVSKDKQLGEQHRVIQEQQHTIATQQQEITSLTSQLTELRSKVCSDKGSLSEQITHAIQAAIKEACDAKSVNVLGDVAELLMNRINNTVRSCCLETCNRLQPSTSPSSPVITVPCC